VVLCDRNRPLTLSAPVVIDKPLTIRDVTAERCRMTLRVSYTTNVVLDNVRVTDHNSPDSPISLVSCDGLSIRDVTILNTACKRAALLVQDCNQTTIDGLVLRGTMPTLASGVSYVATAGRPLAGLYIHHVTAPHVRQAGVVLSAERRGGTLTDFVISENLARIANTMKVERGIIRNNLPETPAPSE
jgi:hypothetical protein